MADERLHRSLALGIHVSLTPTTLLLVAGTLLVVDVAWNLGSGLLLDGSLIVAVARNLESGLLLGALLTVAVARNLDTGRARRRAAQRWSAHRQSLPNEQGWVGTKDGYEQ